MRLTFIEITGMHKIKDKQTIDLNNFTYLNGANGAGKTTIINAIQLALLGYIPGTAKKPGAIFKHANGISMSVRLTLTDGIKDYTVERIYSKPATAVTSKTILNPATFDLEALTSQLELPIFDFNRFVGMTSNELKDWFIKFLPSVDQTTNWTKEFNECLKENSVTDEDKETIAGIVRYIEKMELSGLEEVKSANNYIKELLSMWKGIVTQCQNTISSLIHYEDVEDTLSATELQENLHASKLKQDALRHTMSQVQMNDDIKRQLLEYENTVEHLQDKKYIDELQSNVDVLTVKLASINAALVEKELAHGANEELKRNKEYVLTLGHGVCPYTQQECDTANSSIDEAKQEIESITAECAKTSAILKEAEQEKADATRELNAALELLSNMETNNANYTQLQGLLLDAVKDLDMDELQAEFNQLDEDISKLHDDLVKVEANEQYNTLLDKMTADKYRAERNMILGKALEKHTGVNGLQSTIMNAPFKAASEDISTILSKLFCDNSKAEFLIDGGANSFEFGRIYKDKYIPFQLNSSGERCLYTLALVISLIRQSNTPLPLILVDDLLDHLDDIHLDNVFDVLLDVSSELQIILAGVKPCNTETGKVVTKIID